MFSIFLTSFEIDKNSKGLLRHLEIAKELRNQAGGGRSYGNLGNAYHGLGQLKTTIEYHQRHLEVTKEVGDKIGAGISHGNLGNAYQSLGK